MVQGWPDRRIAKVRAATVWVRSYDWVDSPRNYPSPKLSAGFPDPFWLFRRIRTMIPTQPRRGLRRLAGSLW